MDLEKEVNWLVKNWDRVPDEFKSGLKSGWSSSEIATLPNVKVDGAVVIFLLDRQKPSVERDYSFDEERIGVNRFGQVIWGFDSGCSCPSPWNDSFPDCYEPSCESWKEFEVNLSKFDKDYKEEIEKNIARIKEKMEK